MSIVPLGFGRMSTSLQTHRAYANLSATQSKMSRYEQQLMTELQYQYGSDSPWNASTTLSVQAQIERKAQNATNIKSTQSYLSATDTTLSRLNSLTDEARGYALDAINTTTDSTQRSALAQNVKQMIQQVFDFGNYSFQGRYMFAGSTTDVRPFAWNNNYSTVQYVGAESNIYSWSDTDLLTQTNMNGVDVFGAISDPVRGSVDVNPAIAATTLLKDLNGGEGVEKGSIRFSYTRDGIVSNFDVDLSRCSNLGDVKKAIEQSCNPYCTITVDLTKDGLSLSMSAGTLGSLSISEVGKGKVAAQLGLPTGKTFTSQQPLVGKDVDPALTATTLISDMLGYNAHTTLRFAGANNDIEIKAFKNGETYIDPTTGESLPLNGISIALQSDTNTLPGQETVEYDAKTQQILVHIHPDSSSANNIIDAFNAASATGTIPPLTASPSSTDQQSASRAGTGIVSLLPGSPTVFGTTRDGSGEQFDPSGLRVVNGGQTYTITFEDCNTVGDMLAKLNDPQYGLYATINAEKNGFDVRTRISGADFEIGENGGKTASQLGIRTLDASTPLSELDYGRGVSDYDGPGTNAYAVYSGVAANSSLRITARNEGADWNDYTINYVPTSDPQGKVVVSFDEAAKTINIGINPGVTKACEVVEAFNAQPGPKQYFDIELDTTDGPNTGEGVVYDGFVKTAHGEAGGIDFTITRNDGTTLKIDIHGAETIGDVLRIINENKDNQDGLLVARLAENGNGIELVDKSFGNSTTRVDRTLLSTSAIELGLVNLGEEYRTATTPGTQASATIDFGVDNSSLLILAKSVGTYANDVSVEFVEGEPGFVWDAASKTLRFSIEAGVTTANDVIALFQSEASDTVRAMFDIQNGANADGLPSNGSGAVSPQTGTMIGGVNNLLTGNDPNPKEAESLYNALIRLQYAMDHDDTREIERATQLLDDAVKKIDLSRTEIGVRQNSLDNVQARLSEEYIQHEETLNNTYRIDYADASLGYMAQQLAMQSTLQITTAMLRMTLLNYL